MDDVIGSITGTATFDKVVITSADAGELFELTGYYLDSTTTYRTPRLEIGGLMVEGRIEDEITLESVGEMEFVWVEATESVLSVTKEKPPSAEESTSEE